MNGNCFLRSRAVRGFRDKSLSYHLSDYDSEMTEEGLTSNKPYLSANRRAKGACIYKRKPNYFQTLLCDPFVNALTKIKFPAATRMNDPSGLKMRS